MGGLTGHEADLPVLGGLSVFNPTGEKLKKCDNSVGVNSVPFSKSTAIIPTEQQMSNLSPTCRSLPLCIRVNTI